MLFIGAAGESPQDSWCGPSGTWQQSEEGFLEVSAAPVFSGQDPRAPLWPVLQMSHLSISILGLHVGNQV